MVNKKRKRYRLVLVRTSPLVKILILAAILLSTIAMVVLQVNIETSRNRYNAMRQYAITLEGDNADLDKRSKELGSVESALGIALDDLGLVQPDSIIVTPGN